MESTTVTLSTESNSSGVNESGREMLIAGRWVTRPGTFQVRNPLDQRLVATVCYAIPSDVDDAVSAAIAALERDFAAHERYDLLMRAAALVEAQKDDYARTVALEGSKTIREAQREPLRVEAILRLSVEEGRRMAGQTLPFDSRVGSENRVGDYFHFPVGVVEAITPFNDPLVMRLLSSTPRGGTGLAKDKIDRFARRKRPRMDS
jgi:acyl-CoA reductase-like NAD-dependent aldehyde dehydrogenase